MRRRPSAIALVLGLAMALAPRSGPAAEPQTMTMEQYRGGLRELAAAAAAGDAARAGGLAAALMGSQVEHPGEILPADATVLQAVASASSPQDLRVAAISVRALLDSLPAGGADAATRAQTAPDADLLRRLAEANARAHRPEGGSLVAEGVRVPSLSERARESLRSLLDGLAELLGDLFRWLLSLLRSGAPAAGAMGPLTVVMGTVIAVLVAALLVLALAALRRRRDAEAPAPDDAASAAAADADPLARTVAGWERRAGELAAAGRLREAVRAWYNGVLATLYAAGLVHYRKGRTNWEYVALLRPDLAWRGRFTDLTTRFDREWYGLNRTTADAFTEFETLARAVIASARSSSGAAAPELRS